MPKRTYRAFISYSHRDGKWGKWLQSALESYRVPKDLIGRKTPMGVVPQSLRPIFRDRLDLSAGPSLQDQLNQALEASEHLIVICSPSSAQSEYVNEEVRRFKALGKSDRILALIVDGDPGGVEDGCFPTALRFVVDAAGEITDEALEPVGADLRPEADGKDLAKLKVISGLLGLDLDDLRKREALAERRRKRILFGVAASMAVLAIAATGTAAWTFLLLKENQNLVKTQVKLIDGTLQRATGLMDDAVEFSQREGIPAAMPQRILRQVEAMFQELADTGLGDDVPALKEREAVMLIRLGENLGVLGDTATREHYAQRAVKIVEPLVEDGTAPAELLNIFAWGQTVLGVAYTTRGDLRRALEHIKKGFAIRTQLVDTDPGNNNWQRSLSNSHARIGDLQLAMGDTRSALSSYETALRLKTRLSALDTANTDLKGELSDVHMHIARVHERRADVQSAFGSFEAGLTILQTLTKSEPHNANWSRELAVIQSEMGDLFLGSEQLDEARKWYDASFEVRKRLARADPENLPRQSDLAFGYTQYGQLFAAEGLYEQALKEHRKAYEIRKRLHETDLPNAVWKVHLGQSERYIGDVQQRSKNFGAALAAYTSQRDILRELVAEDPTNLNWKLDLARNYIATGGVLSQTGNTLSALKTYQDAVEIEQKLAAADASNGPIYEDLFNLFSDIGDIRAGLKQESEAAQSFKAAKKAVEHLGTLRPHGPRLQSVIAPMYERFGRLQHKLGELEAAEKLYQESLSVRRDLAKARPNELKHSGNLALRYLRTSQFYKAQGRNEEALELLNLGSSVIARLTVKEPDRKRWRQISGAINAEIRKLQPDQ